MEYTKEILQEKLNRCLTKADFCRELGLKPTSGNYSKVDKIINFNNLDFSHYQGLHWKKGKRVLGYSHRSLDEILVEHSTYMNTNHLKKRLWREGLKPMKCESCGCQSENVPLELHHINGDTTDNRIENLQILCPNCHSKTVNFRGRNMGTSTRTHTPSIETILDEETVIRREELRKEKRIKKKEREPKEQICLFCGKTFENYHKQKYCSVECYQQDTRGHRPDLLRLINDFKECGSFLQVGKKYGVSDRAVCKWCKLYGLPIHSKELKEYVKNF